MDENTIVLISKAFISNTTISELNLAGCELNEKSLETIADVLGIIFISILSLSKNDSIGNNGAKHIAKIVSTTKTLTSLSVERIGIDYIGVKTLMDALQSNISVTKLDLTTNNVGKEGALSISILLQCNRTLSELILLRTNLGDDGVKDIMSTLASKNHTLTHLDLTWNGISDVGATAIGEALKTNTGLKTLILNRNTIEADGGLALFNGLNLNSVLTTLSLNQTKIKESKITEIENLLSKNKGLPNSSHNHTTHSSHSPTLESHSAVIEQLSQPPNIDMALLLLKEQQIQSKMDQLNHKEVLLKEQEKKTYIVPKSFTPFRSNSLPKKRRINPKRKTTQYS